MLFSLKKFFSKELLHHVAKPDSVVGIDIGASSIKVVQLRAHGGRATLETYGTIALGPYGKVDIGETTNLGAPELVSALADVLREAGVTTKSSAFSMPSSASLIFILDLPAVIEEEQLATVVPTQARKYIPVPMNEVTLDWQIIPKKEEIFEDSVGLDKNKEMPKMQVLLVAVHNDTISKYQEVIKRSSLTAPVFEVETFSSIRSSFANTKESSLFIDFGALKTKLAVIEHGLIKHFHVINRGSRDMTTSISTALGISFVDAEKYKREYGLYGAPNEERTGEVARQSIDFIIAEIGTTILQYERKYGKKISKLVCAGGGALLKGLDIYVGEALALPVELSNPFAKTEAPAFLNKVLASAGPEFTIATGLALRALEN